jgi:hypothetical protein
MIMAPAQGWGTGMRDKIISFSLQFLNLRMF